MKPSPGIFAAVRRRLNARLNSRSAPEPRSHVSVELCDRVARRRHHGGMLRQLIYRRCRLERRDRFIAFLPALWRAFAVTDRLRFEQPEDRDGLRLYADRNGDAVNIGGDADCGRAAFPEIDERGFRIRPVAARSPRPCARRNWSSCISVSRCPAGWTERPNSLRFHCGVLSENGSLQHSDLSMRVYLRGLGEQSEIRVTRRRVASFGHHFACQRINSFDRTCSCCLARSLAGA